MIGNCKSSRVIGESSDLLRKLSEMLKVFRKSSVVFAKSSITFEFETENHWGILEMLGKSAKLSEKLPKEFENSANI